MGCVLLAGCASGRKFSSGDAGDGRVTALNVITVPVALNLNQRPGPDGFSAKVYANKANTPKTIPLKDGKLEILMFDGTFFGKTNVPPPLKTWTFDSGQLEAFGFDAGIGHGYQFTLLWENSLPRERVISIAARYTDAAGRIVTSRPSTVTVADLP